MKNYFEQLSTNELLTAYAEYQKLNSTSSISKEDGHGHMHQAIHECANIPYVKQMLLEEMAARWASEHTDASEKISVGDILYYADEEGIEKGTVSSTHYNDQNELVSFGVDFENDFDEFDGSAIGHCFFRSKTDAEEMLRHL